MKTHKIIISVLIVGFIALATYTYVAFNYLFEKDSMSIYYPCDISPILVDENLRNTKKDSTVNRFDLLNKSSKATTQNTHNNKSSSN